MTRLVTAVSVHKVRLCLLIMVNHVVPSQVVELRSELMCRKMGTAVIPSLVCI